jgi:IS5 family transposase
MKLHIGVDSQSGLAHSVVVTAANVHDKHPLPDLLHGDEQRVYGDSAYASQKELIASKAPMAKDFTNQRTRFKGVIDQVGSAYQEAQQFTHSLAGGACLWRDQAVLGIWQSASPQLAKERDAGVHGIGTGQHLSWSAELVGTGASMN